MNGICQWEMIGMRIREENQISIKIKEKYWKLPKKPYSPEGKNVMFFFF